LKKLIVVVAVLFLSFSVVAASFDVLHPSASQKGKLTQCYVGVAFCGNTTAEAKLLIDRVRDYTNLFVMQSGPVSWNETATNEVCNYAVASGLNVIVYFGDLNPRVLARKHLEWRTTWVSTAKSRWGNQFLGIFYYDEPGGIWIDTNWTALSNSSSRFRITSNSTYASAEQLFVSGLQNDGGVVMLKNNSIPIFVSDYALYWFDYMAGYDVVLAQVGWNCSLTQQIALVRGAATVQNKSWGVEITWKYDELPYLDSGAEIYRQITAAYEAGAKFITIFNYPQLATNSYGVMQNEHFNALKKFWNDAISNRILYNSMAAKAVYVLPSHYGWGMRTPDDRIWGYWGPDEKTPLIWEQSRTLLSDYGLSLDVIYENANFSLKDKYSSVYWFSSDKT
jgi:hypothetical protein